MALLQPGYNLTLPQDDSAYQIKQGNESVFEKIFRQYYARLCGYAMKFISDKEQAEEIVQELFYNLWEKREKVDIVQSMEAYLFRSVRNASLNYLKHQKIRDQYAKKHNDSQPFRGASVHETLEFLELQERIDEAIELLPPERKKIFKLSRMEGYKYKEIAVRLNISVKTVEVQMSKALEFLRSHLSDYLVILILMAIHLVLIFTRHG